MVRESYFLNHLFQFSSETTAQSFVTTINEDTVKDIVTPKSRGGVHYVENIEPNYDNVDKTTKFTNGPHGAEYQLGSRIPHSHFPANNVRDNNFNFINPIKQSRKDTDGKNPPISLITPLTHLTISGSFPSKNDVTVTPLLGTSTPSSTPIYSDSLHQVNNPYHQNTIQSDRESNRPNPQQPLSFFTVTTPKNEPSRGLITHMNAISQTRFQSSRVTPSLASVTPNDEQTPNDLIFNQPANYFNPDVQHNIRPDVTPTSSQPELVKSTEFPFLYTRSRTTSSNNEHIPYQGEANLGSSSPDLLTKTPNEELTIYSEFGQKIKPGTNPATTSFTAYYPGSTSRPVSKDDAITPSTDQGSSYKAVPYENLPYQPKFVLRPTVRPAISSNRQPFSSFNGYPDAENRNANFYPDSGPQKSPEFNDKNVNNIQPESKYVNTKKEFVPQYNPSSTPIPGSL